MRPTFKQGDRVYDRWWPDRFGRIVRLLKTRTHVLWSDSELWSYDRAHLQFLQPLKARR